MPESGLKSRPVPVQAPGPGGPTDRPKGESTSKEETASIPIPGTPFRLTAEGRLQVAVDLQELLTNQGIPAQLAQRLVEQKDPEAVAKVLLNALYLQSQGKLQNGPGYIRAGIEDGYELLPQVASRLEIRRRELEDQLRNGRGPTAATTRGPGTGGRASGYLLCTRAAWTRGNRPAPDRSPRLLPEPIVQA